jgi:heme-degrading monooxygenase HmoA
MYRVILKDIPKEGQEEAYIAQWQRGSDIIQTYPGALGTKLFRKADEPGVIYAIADWVSKEDRKSAFEKIRQERPDAEEVLSKFKGFLESHETVAEYELIAESPSK